MPVSLYFPIPRIEGVQVESSVVRGEGNGECRVGEEGEAGGVVGNLVRMHVLLGELVSGKALKASE